MSLPVPLAMTILEAALAAKAGRLTGADRMALAMAALGPEADAATRAAVRGFLAACQQGDPAEAGAVLQGWLIDAYPLPPDAAGGWQGRADCGHGS